MSTQPPSRTNFYLDKKHGKVMGVCAGLADYTGMDVTLVRILLVLAIICGGAGVLIPAYFITGWIANDKPRELANIDPEEQKFWQGVRTSPSRTARDIKSRFRDLDRRLAQIEHYVTIENRSLAREIEQLR
jgi:phage shock protein C